MRTYAKRAAKHAQNGQALPIGLALILMGALATLVLFNTGKLASEKSNLANTADAAVYSGLVWQARTLNFQAYTNRAMVANQVSMAQLVSIGSWTNYGRISAQNVDYAIGWIPVVAPFTSAAVNIMTQVENIVQSAVKVAIPIIDAINGVLSIAQEAVYNASYVVTPEVVSSIVKSNDPRYRASSTYALAAQARNSAAWEDLTQRYSGSGEEIHRKVTVIESSRDRFSSDRGWNRMKPLPSRIYVTPIDRFKIVKEGSTRLVRSGDSWEWRGKDTLSVHWDHFSCWRCKWRSEELPMGWGQNYAYSDSQCPGGDCSGWMRSNPRAEELADLEGESLGDIYSGVKSHRSLKDLSNNSRDVRVTLHVEIEVGNGNVRTAEKINQLGSANPPDGQLATGLEPGLFYTDDYYADDDMASMSSAEVFFERPVLAAGDQLQVAGVGGVHEYANLFNPYWDVRLIEVSEKERQLAWLSRDSAVSGQVIARFARQAAAKGLARNTELASETINNATVSNVARYASLGDRAVNTLSSGILEDVVRDDVLGALQNIATNALSNYAASSLGGEIGGFAADALADGELSTDDLSRAARDALGDRLEGTQLADAVALGEGIAADAGNLPDVLIAQAGLADTADRLNEQLKALGSDMGEDIIASLNEQFSAEIELKEQLESLGSSLEVVGENFEAQVSDISNELLAGAQDSINAQLDGLEQQFRDSYGEEISLDRDEILGTFTGRFDDIAEGLIGESSDAVQATVEGVQDAISEHFASLEINPDSVSNGLYQKANEFVGEQASAAEEQIQAALNEAGELIVEVSDEQIEGAIEEANETVNDIIEDYRAAPEERLRLPRYGG
ncbi:MAG: pilus assembly protein TadG-related protein [Pseudomonadota bacterium]